MKTSIRIPGNLDARATGPAIRPTRTKQMHVYGVEVDADRAWHSKIDFPGEVKITVVLKCGKSILVTLHPSTAAELGAAITSVATQASTPEPDDD